MNRYSAWKYVLIGVALLPLIAEVTRLRTDIGASEKRLDGSKFTEAAIIVNFL